MSLQIVNIPNKQFAPGETITTAKLNQLGSQTSSTSGTVGASDLGAGAITAAKSQSDAYWFGTTSGTSTALTLDLGAGLRPTSLSNGVIVRAKLHTTIGSAATLTVTGASGSALTTKAIRRPPDQTVNANDFAANQIVDFTYNTSGNSGAGAWIAQTIAVATTTPVVSEARNLLSFNNASVPATQIDITADSIILVDSSNNGYLAAAISLTINSQTTGANALDTGALAAGWYYTHVIYDGATVSGLLSSSATAPVMPSGYTYKALVGAVYATSGSNIRTFWQYERQIWIDSVLVFTAQQVAVADTWEVLAGADLTAFRISVPPIAKVFNGIVGVTGTTHPLRFAISACTDAGGADQANTIGASVMCAPVAADTWNILGTAHGSGQPFTCPVRAQNFQWTAADATPNHTVFTTGYMV